MVLGSVIGPKSNVIQLGTLIMGAKNETSGCDNNCRTPQATQKFHLSCQSTIYKTKFGALHAPVSSTPTATTYKSNPKALPDSGAPEVSDMNMRGMGEDPSELAWE